MTFLGTSPFFGMVTVGGCMEVPLFGMFCPSKVQSCLGLRLFSRGMTITLKQSKRKHIMRNRRGMSKYKETANNMATSFQQIKFQSLPSNSSCAKDLDWAKGETGGRVEAESVVDLNKNGEKTTWRGWLEMNHLRSQLAPSLPHKKCG